MKHEMDKNKRFAIWIVLLFSSILLGCSRKEVCSTENLINVDLLDVFVNVPDLDDRGRFTDIPVLYFTFEVQNNSRDNYYFLFNNWMESNNDSVGFYFATNCLNNNDSMKIRLAYVTSPDLFIESKVVDTVVLKTDFRELKKYFNECTTTDKEKITEALKCIYIRYESFKVQKVIYENRRKFIPVDFLGQTVCQRINSQ